MSTTTIRPINVHLTFANDPYGRAITQVIGEPVRFVATQKEADLILFTETCDVVQGFNKEKPYAYIPMQVRSVHPQFPKNVRILERCSLPLLLELIADVSSKLPETKAIETAVEEPAVELLLDALSILVIDDTPKHIASAKKGLAGHRLTTATGYQEAMELLGKEKFDVVLTDLHLPMSSKTMGDKFKLGELVPYGILLMIEAARQGAKKVAVVTDLSHHDDPFSAAFDHFSQFPISIEGATVLMLHAQVSAEGKDWAEALQCITQ